MTLRRSLAFCLLLLASGAAHADNWDGFQTFVAEFVIALPWSLLFLSINIGWVICRRGPGTGMVALALLTVLGPMGVLWVAFHDARDAASFRTIVVANCMAAAVAVLPLAIASTNAWRAKRRAMRGPTLSDLAAGAPADPPSPGSRWMSAGLGWILVATGATIGVLVLRLALVSYLQDRQHGLESFEVVFLLGELAAFAAPPAIIGTALLLRDRKR